MERDLNGIHRNMCLVNLDDIIIFSTILDSHLQCLTRVFVQICAAGLKLKPSKCHLLQRCIHHLGHVVSEEGIPIDLSKTQAVDDLPTSQNLGDVRSFMGLCGYYRRFVPDLATLAKPLV